MIDGKVWEGVNSLLDNYVEICADDTVIIAYTRDSYESVALVSAILEFRNIKTKRVPMVRLKDAGFLERFTAALPPPNKLPARLVVMTFERDTMSHTDIIRAALSGYDKNRYIVFRAISACDSLFSGPMRTPPQDVSSRNTTILKRLMPARDLRIKTSGGTDISVQIDTKRYRWISNRGASSPGNFTIIPAGEVATFPASIEGIFVADFAWNINAITDRDTRLHDHPITIRIERGRAVKYECADLQTARFLEECFDSHCAYNVGELGFGTNVGVENSIPLNSHINERRTGVHLGFGQHNQDANTVGYQCLIHLDLIAKGGVVWVDDDPEPLDLDNVVRSLQPHPTDSQDEDVFSPSSFDDLEIDDCCGILTNEGIQLFAIRGL